MLLLCVVTRTLIFPQVGHSHRHDDMKIKLLPEAAAKRDFEVGLVKRLVGPEPKAKALQALSAYGCRHCPPTGSELRVKKTRPRKFRTLIENPASGSKDHTMYRNDQTHPVSKPPSDKYTGAFTFFGLRSHLNEK
jgi:hypothetical protein